MKLRRSKTTPSKKRKTVPSKRSFRPAQAIERATSLIHTVCCILGSTSLLDELRSSPSNSLLQRAIEQRDTAALYNWLIDTLSYQGISDAVAFGYMERHGRATWKAIAAYLARRPSCPKLRDFWSFEGCSYNKTRRSCARMDHIGRCPVPRFRLRNGRLNQTAFALWLFTRDIAANDLFGWIDTQLEIADGYPGGDPGAHRRESLIGPLRTVYGISDKVLSMALSMILMSAPRTKPRWFDVGIGMVAIDTLVHNFLHRSGVLFRLNAEHRYGIACYRDGGCADILQRVAELIDTRQFNPTYPKLFPRFVQHVVWQFCAQLGHDVCNGNQINDYVRCANITCQLFHRCDRKVLHPMKPDQTALARDVGIQRANLKETTMATKRAAKPKSPKSKAAKPNTAKTSKSPHKAAKSIDPDASIFILFGRDVDEKPRAARLPDFNASLVRHAARIMGYRACETSYGDHPEILKRLPLGRIYADGKALAPVVSEETYDMITAAVGGDLGRIAIEGPKAWTDLAPGQVVLANYSGEDGWWEAVVVGIEEDLIKIKWRDFQQDEPIGKRLEDLALMGQLVAK